MCHETNTHYEYNETSAFFYYFFLITRKIIEQFNFGVVIFFSFLLSVKRVGGNRIIAFRILAEICRSFRY